MTAVLGIDPGTQKQRGKIAVVCGTCGNQLYRWPSEIAGTQQFSCSFACRNYKGDKNPNWRGSESEGTCGYCGKSMKVYSWRRQNEGQYCSFRCSRDALRKVFSSRQASRVLDELERSLLPLPLFAKKFSTSDVVLRRMLTQHFPERYASVLETRRMSKDKWYSIGRRFEYRVKTQLDRLGFLVQVSPGSKGAADLTARRADLLLFVQCKRYGQITRQERERLVLHAEKETGVPLLATRGTTGKLFFFRVRSGYRVRRSLFIVGA